MIIFSTIVLGLVIGWQTYMTIMANTTEQQPYQLLERRGSIEIRFYPPAYRASVAVRGDYEFMRNRGFRELAGYIFGGNDRNEQIAMTAPVIMEMQTSPQQDSAQANSSASTSASTMTFVMPRNFDMHNHPAPKSNFISFSETEPVYTASLTVGGFPGLAEMETLKRELFRTLDAQGLQYDPTAEFLSYNPPTQLVGRRNEVLVRLRNFTP